MNEDLEFRFSVRRVPEGEALTFAEIEQHFLKQLSEKDGKCVQSLGNLAEMYARAGRHDEACDYVRRMITLTDDPEKHAGYYMALGCFMERARDYEGAVKFYRQALGREPCSTHTWYFIHNNLGFSLNQVGRYDDAIPYLRHAIEIDPGRPNAYKNLGLAFEAMGQFAQAAQLFVSATQVEASDARSLAHLENLMAAHPELEADLPDLRIQLEACRKAVEVARAQQPDLQAAWERDRKRQKKRSRKRKE